MSDIRSDDQSDEQDEQPAGFTVLTPIPLSVRAHLRLHLLEVLLLLIPQFVVSQSLWRCQIQPERYNGDKT